jgi:hypothetical protein
MQKVSEWGTGTEAEADRMFRALEANAELHDAAANAAREAALCEIIGPCPVTDLLTWASSVVQFAREQGYQDISRDFTLISVSCPKRERRWREALIRWLLEHADLLIALIAQ